MTTQLEATAIDLEKVEEFAMKVAIDQATASHALLTYLGDRLGLWKALASVDRATSAQLAQRSGLSERYVREWLSAHTAGGYVTYDPEDETFSLPAEHAMVLAEDEGPASQVAGYEITAAIWAASDRLAHAYVSGDGVGWHEHDSRLFTGVDRFFRNLYRTSLLTEWLPAVDGLVQRLESGLHVVDVGCGLGSATIQLAEAFPASTFVGVDYHEESIRQATAAAEEAGVADRVRFEVGDATSYAGRFDLVCFFDAVHDMGDPVGALRHARSVLANGGEIFAVEPFAHDRLEDAVGSPVALSYFVSSSSLCVPNSVSQGGAALGAQAGPTALISAFTDAGFTHAKVAAATPYNLVLEARA